MNRKILLSGFVCVCMILLSSCQKSQEPEQKIILTDEKEEKSENSESVTVPDDEKDRNTDGETENSSADENVENMMQKKDFLISIDPGHQSPEVDMSEKEPNAPGSEVLKRKATGGTTGKYSGIPEYQLNLDISIMLRDSLEAQGYDVILTRENNETAISNAERAIMANEAGADIALRIHANGSENVNVNGALVLIGSQENAYVGSLYEDSYRLGELVLNAYCTSTGMKNLGVQVNDTMTGINWSEIPVIILEMGFMTNKQDDLNMENTEYREKMIEGIVQGINDYYESVD